MFRRTITALGLAALLFGSAQAQDRRPDGPLFTADQMTRGTVMSEADCAAYRSTVFVVASGTGLCFRYYLSAAGGSAADAVYFLQGDREETKMTYDPFRLGTIAEAMSRAYRRPAVYLARMGIDGSSGSHGFRRTWFEVEATHLAIDAINSRHGFRMIHVMGQSGGGHLTGALVGTRSDIGCAIPGSGRLAFDRQYRAQQERRPAHLRHYSPDAALAQVVQHSATTRILVVTDPNDRRVPAHMQTGFVDEVQRAGGRIAQFYVAATDPLSHGSVPYIRVAMTGCLLGKSDAEIGDMLERTTRQQWARHVPARRSEAPPPPVLH